MCVYSVSSGTLNTTTIPVYDFIINKLELLEKCVVFDGVNTLKKVLYSLCLLMPSLSYMTLVTSVNNILKKNK